MFLNLVVNLVLGQKSNSLFTMNHHYMVAAAALHLKRISVSYSMKPDVCSFHTQWQASTARISQRCLVLLVALAHAALNELGQQLHGREIEHHGGRQGDSCGMATRGEEE